MLIEYHQKGHTVTGHQYSGQLKRLREAIKEKRPRKLTRGILFHQDNAPVHTSVVFENSPPSTLFARPSPLRLSSFPTNEKILGWLPFCQR